MIDITNEQKLKFVKEKAGECWHEHGNVMLTCMPPKYKCLKCGAIYLHNPSPTDLNELFRLAEKLEIRFIKFVTGLAGQQNVEVPHLEIGVIQYCGTTKAEALLNALYKACGGKDE